MSAELVEQLNTFTARQKLVRPFLLSPPRNIEAAVNAHRMSKFVTMIRTV